LQAWYFSLGVPAFSSTVLHCCQLNNSIAIRSTPMRALRTYVTVVGRVVRVRTRGGGGWRLRLADTGGALAAAEIRPSHPLPLPPIGSRIVIRGALRYDEEHRWYVVDPVEQWLESRGS
jgi:hypothetical protein